MKVTEYITTADYKFSKDIFDERTLPQGSFVKPIHPNHLPVHIKDSEMYKWMNIETEIIVYTHFGIMVIAKDIVREV